MPTLDDNDARYNALVAARARASRRRWSHFAPEHDAKVDAILVAKAQLDWDDVDADDDIWDVYDVAS